MVAAEAGSLGNEPFPASLSDPQPAAAETQHRSQEGRRRLPPGEAAPTGGGGGPRVTRPPGDVGIAQLFLPD
eukprot:6168550-Pleurochrysis_carterae.AAC.1